MKKIMNTSLIYFVLAMAGGVFYREFTKWNGYTEPTTLGDRAGAFVSVRNRRIFTGSTICKSDRTGKEFFI